MTTMSVSPFTRCLLAMFSGPLIWAGHFLAVYVFVALACARGFSGIAWLGVNISQWAISVLTCAALVAIGAIVVAHARRKGNGMEFVPWSTVTLGLLSAISVVWTAVPAYFVPVCG